MKPKKSYAARATLNQASIWKGRRPLLLHLDIELTERCNNNCIHCYINLPAHDVAARERELTTGEIKDLLREAARLGCLSVRFTGGEPLLRDDFEELYLFTRRLGIKVILFTNATLINTHLAEIFSLIPPLENIEVTLYGMKKSSYETVTRVPGSFEAAWHGISLLLEKSVPFVVRGVLLPPNKGEFKAFEEWASTIPWMDDPPDFSTILDLRCRSDSKEKNRLIRELRMSPDELVGILTRDRKDYVKEIREFCEKFIGPDGKNLFTCGAGDGVCIDAYGHLQPCMLVRHPDAVYHLKTGSLEDALTRFFPEVRKRKAENPAYLDRCGRCFLTGLCEQCPGRSWMEHGTLDTPVEYLCEIAHQEARYLGLLTEGEKAWEVEDWKERLSLFVNNEMVK